MRNKIKNIILHNDEINNKVSTWNELVANHTEMLGHRNIDFHFGIDSENEKMYTGIFFLTPSENHPINAVNVCLLDDFSKVKPSKKQYTFIASVLKDILAVCRLDLTKIIHQDKKGLGKKFKIEDMVTELTGVYRPRKEGKPIIGNNHSRKGGTDNGKGSSGETSRETRHKRTNRW